MDGGLKRVLQWTLLVKVGILLLVAFGYWLFPFNEANYQANFHYPPGESLGFTTHFKTWDAQHYLYLAEQGYGPGQISNAFYPLFPLLIRAASHLFLGNKLAAGLILSLLFTFVSMGYLYGLARQDYGSHTASRACLALLVFPTAFYLGLVYSESLFLALVCGFFYYLRKGKTMPAMFFAFLLPFSRPTGILVALPAFLHLLTHGREAFRRGRWTAFLGFGAGFGAYLLLMKLFTGDAFSGFEAQKYFLSGYSISNFLHPMDWQIRNFFSVKYSINEPGTSFLNRLFFLAFLLTAVSMRRAFKYWRWEFNSYSLLLGLVPLFGNLMSYMRFMAVLFPMFIFLAVRFRGSMLPYFCICFPAQVFFAVYHSLNGWIA